jgi:hypothetical protein
MPLGCKEKESAAKRRKKRQSFTRRFAAGRAKADFSTPKRYYFLLSAARLREMVL